MDDTSIPPDVAALVGGVAPTLWDEAKQQARRLRINRGWRGPFSILFDQRLTYDRVRLVDEGHKWARFCHVLVHNASSVNIPGCIATLRSVARRTPGNRFVPVPTYRRRLQLRWANVGSMDAVEVEAHDMARLDLCYTVEGTEELRFAVPHGPHGVQTDYGPGIYKVTVRAVAPSAIPTDESFFVIHDGNWETFAAKQEIPGDQGRAITAEEIARVESAERRFLVPVRIKLTEGTFGPAITEVASRGTALESNNVERIPPRRDDNNSD